jgi:hypothetical protein
MRPSRSRSRRAEGLDLHAHDAVGQAAVLGALALVEPRLVGLMLELVGSAGHGVHLAVQRGIQNEWITSLDWILNR